MSVRQLALENNLAGESKSQAAKHLKIEKSTVIDLIKEWDNWAVWKINVLRDDGQFMT